MIKYINKKIDEKGVSPVIGVILLVALVVGLVALASFFFISTGDDVSESPDAAVQFTETSNGAQATVVQNENVDEFQILGPDNNEIATIETVGDRVDLEEEVEDELEDGEYTIISVIDGEEQVLQSEEIQVNDEVEQLSGTVQVNPPIPGATVEAHRDNEVIDSTTTNDDGEYDLNVADDFDGEIVVDVSGVDVSDEVDEVDNELYAGSSRDVTSEDENINFTFDETESITGNVNQETIDIIYDSMESESETNPITNPEMLQGVNHDLEDNYELVRDINAGKTENWNDENGWIPIGFDLGPFTGDFNGNNYEIKDIYIDNPDLKGGLFQKIGETTYGTHVRNIKISNVDFTVNRGGILALTGTGIENVHVEGEITGDDVSGLMDRGGIISDSSVNGTINANESAAGIALQAVPSSSIENSYTLGEINVNSSDSIVGGINGSTWALDSPERVEIKNSFNGMNINVDSQEGDNGDGVVGGIVSNNDTTDLENVYNIGNIDAADNQEIFGITSFGSIESSYSTGDLIGNDITPAISGNFYDQDSDLIGNNTLDEVDQEFFGVQRSKMQGDELNDDFESSLDISDGPWETVSSDDLDTTEDGYPILSTIDREIQLEAQGILNE